MKKLSHRCFERVTVAIIENKKNSTLKILEYLETCLQCSVYTIDNFEMDLEETGFQMKILYLEIVILSYCICNVSLFDLRQNLMII